MSYLNKVNKLTVNYYPGGRGQLKSFLITCHMLSCHMLWY